MSAASPSPPDPLTKMAEGLRTIASARIGLTRGPAWDKDRAVLDLAIRIAEIIAANPRGFRQWAKLTSGAVL